MVSRGSNLGEAVLRLVADASGLDKSLDRAESDTTKRLEKLSSQSRRLGTQFTLAGGAIVAALGLSVAKAAEFQQAMAQVQAVSGASAEELQALTDKAKEMGETTAFTAVQAAEALSFMAMAGLSATDSITALPDVLNLAAAGQLELADASDIVTNVMSGYGIAADDVTRATDVLTTGFTSANTDLVQLGTAFQYAGPVAKAAGLTFEETAAALSMMGNAGIQGSMAGTSLRGSITRLLTPSKEAAATMERLGISVTDSTGELLPLREIIVQLEGAGLSASDAMTIFGQRAGPAMLALVEQGSDALDELTSQMEMSGGTADRIAKTQLDTFSGQMKLAASAAEGLTLSVGEALLPTLRDFMGFVTTVVQNVQSWVKENPALAKTIVLVVGALGLLALTVGAVAVAVSVLSGALAVLSIAGGPFTLIIVLLAAVVAGGVALAANWDWVAEKAGQVWNRIKQAVEKAVNFVIKVINGLTIVHRHAMAAMIDAAVKLADVFGLDLPDGVEKFADKLREGIPEIDIYQEKIAETGVAAVDADAAVTDLAGSVGEADTATAAGAQSAGNYATSLGNQDSAAQGAAQSEQELADAIAKANTARREGAQNLAALRQEIVQATERERELEQATSDLERAEIEVAHAWSDRSSASAQLIKAESELKQVLTDQSATADQVRDAYAGVQLATQNLNRANGVLKQSTTDLMLEQGRQRESLLALQTANAEYQQAELARLGFTELQYSLAQGRIRSMSAEHYAALALEAEEAGARDLALFLLQTEQADKARADALKAERDDYAAHMDDLFDAIESGDEERLDARLDALNDYLYDGNPSLATLSAEEREQLRDHLWELNLAQQSGDDKRLSAAIVALQGFYTEVGTLRSTEKFNLETHLLELEAAQQAGDQQRYAAALRRLNDYLLNGDASVSGLHLLQKNMLADLLTEMQLAHEEKDVARYNGAVERLKQFAKDNDINLGTLLQNWQDNLGSMEWSTDSTVAFITDLLNSIPTEITTVHTVVTQDAGGGGSAPSGGSSSSSSGPLTGGALASANARHSIDGNFDQWARASLSSRQANDVIRASHIFSNDQRRNPTADRILSAFRYAYSQAGDTVFYEDDWDNEVDYAIRRKVHSFAAGGIVPATPGGRIVRVAEAGEDEAIISVDKLADIVAEAAAPSSISPMVRKAAQGLQNMLDGMSRIRMPSVPEAVRMSERSGEDMPMPSGNPQAAMRPQFTVLLDGDLAKLGDFVRAEVLDGDIRGRQEVFRR